MLYRFKSRASPPFVMLETHARQLFDIIGKAPAPKGVITGEQMPAAISALEPPLRAKAVTPTTTTTMRSRATTTRLRSSTSGCTSAPCRCCTC
jgi:hypothetical protein